VLQAPVEPNMRREPDRPVLSRHRSELVFDHVSFAYPEADRSAVQDVSLSIDFGQSIAIVGTNGSGKSTLLNLVPRLAEPTAGRVLIDGVDIADVSLRSLRKQIAMVTQQTVLFEGSIADNIAYGRRHTPRTDIEAAAKAASADGFIQALPRGYDTSLGEAGSGLSGGQKQRICIARAILRDPAILILDEATSQIDAESEAKISEAIEHLREGRTTLIIAHRLSTVVDCDRIIVMDDGHVIDQGKHQELLKRCDVYQTLVRTQLAGLEAEA
jgi:ABC-type multidrug transport system fused ATPase/permease subunit